MDTFHATTIFAIRHNGSGAIAGDGQVTFGNQVIMKQGAKKVRRLYKGKVETIFLMTDPSYSFISSSMAKEVYSLGGNIEGLVPESVLEVMNEKMNSGR